MQEIKATKSTVYPNQYSDLVAENDADLCELIKYS